MNKKILFIAILSIFIIISVGLVSAVNTQTKEKQNKELKKINSPLFKIRTQESIREEETPIKNKIKNIITNFLENRIFLIGRLIKKPRENMDTTAPIDFCTQGELCAKSIGHSTYQCGTCDVNGNCAETCINVCGKDQQPD